MPSSPRSDGSASHLLVLDNHDSFTWNLVQALGALGAQVDVVESDAVTVEDVVAARPDGLVISPGPGTPGDAGRCVPIVRQLGAHIPVLGVCLGHQVIGAAFGAEVVRADRAVHGWTTPVHHHGEGVLHGLPSPFAGMRYHSLLLARTGLPDGLVCTAWTADGEVMAVRHRRLPIEGVQFHPESILTVVGRDLLANFMASVACHRSSLLRCVG